MVACRRSSPALVALVSGAAVSTVLIGYEAFVPPGNGLQSSSSSSKPWGLRGHQPLDERSAMARAATGVQMPTGTVDVSMVRAPSETYYALVDKGAANSQKPVMKIFHQSFIAGCYVGFAGLLSLSISGNIGDMALSSPGLQKMIFAALFPVNLLLILNSGGQLFTGNSATVPMAVIEGKATMSDLYKNWIVSLLGNIAGCVAFAFAAKYAGLLGGGAQKLATYMALMKTSLPFGQAFVRAIMCNWMVCMAVFLSEAARDLGGKMVGIWFPISAFVAMSMEHSVANMFLLPAGILAGAPVTVSQMIVKNWIPVILGNAFAGVVCVAMSYSYAFGALGK
mmetsp:Transcript_47772/g.153887  ORF Transcript_47772/g.153887 Transcript_47772/m.153887 type:complete len:338 (+) Transcript_47772:64-1077(+)